MRRWIRWAVLRALLVTAVVVGVLPVEAQGGGISDVPITEETFFQLIIPDIDLNVSVYEAWMRRRTWEFRVLAEDAGHLQYTRYPGEGGNVVIGGHYELADFVPGPFYRLDELEPGDLIFVYFMGVLYTYQVMGTDLVSPRALTILQPTPYEALTLLTCYDYSPRAATYTQRYIVRAVLVPNPDPLPDLLAVGAEETE